MAEHALIWVPALLVVASAGFLAWGGFLLSRANARNATAEYLWTEVNLMSGHLERGQARNKELVEKAERGNVDSMKLLIESRRALVEYRELAAAISDAVKRGDPSAIDDLLQEKKQ